MLLRTPESWIDGRPPKEWRRLLGCDVGGAVPWALEWAAVDTWGNLIVYDEIYKITTSVDWLVEESRPKMMNEEGEPYNFIAKVIDYENRPVAEDFRRKGILFTNAQKHGKAHSVHRLAGYLRPNPKHHFPDWHPLAGQPNSPRCFITTRCKNLIRELPQQRWKEEVSHDGRLKNELDRSVDNHAVDVMLYLSRELPDASTLKVNPYAATTTNVSKISQMYHYDVARQKEKEASAESRSKYRSHRVLTGQ